MSIAISDFSKVEMKVGRITSVEDIPAARKPMYKLTVELGPNLMKQLIILSGSVLASGNRLRA